MPGRRITTLVAALALVWAAEAISLTPAWAQSTTSTVKGRVIDTDGTGLPTVVIMIRSKSQPTGNKQVVTDIEGNYRIPILPPAIDYLITIDYPGFAKLEVGPLDLDAGKTTVVDMTLRTSAETTETIVVESKGNIVDTERTATSSSYNAEFIEGLPIIGHNYQDILTLAPGVTDTDGDGNPNVHGARDTGLQYRLDGGNITDPVDGGFAQNLNSELIEEIEIITSGASAEYGGADGGFANVISKSGGNDFDGSFKVYWQGKILNGDGADNNDYNSFDRNFAQYQDLRTTLTASGAVVKDKLWYIASVERTDSDRPVNTVDQSILRSVKGNETFGKLTWQVNSDNKLALSVNVDPLTFRGFGLGTGVSPDSDYVYQQSTVVPQIKWTSTISPQLLLESLVLHLAGRYPVTPVSSYFEPTEVTLATNTGGTVLQARYPCEVPNCNPQRGEKRTYVVDLITNRVSGPFNLLDDQRSGRNAIKTDLSYNIEDMLGQHNIKAGIEFQDESFRDDFLLNPTLVDLTEPFTSTVMTGGGASGGNDQVRGAQLLQVADPLVTPQGVSRFASSAYIQNAWKPRPNLTVNLGLRIEREDIDTSGFKDFDPISERRNAIVRWAAVCAEHRAQLGATSPSSNCYVGNPFDGLIPDETAPLATFRDSNMDGINDIDPLVLALDADQNGIIEASGNQIGTDGAAIYQDFTRYVGRETSNFSIKNNNLAPRVSISWDPFSDGKTKVFGTWGRFWDRLFLRAVGGEIGPDGLSFAYVPSPTSHLIVPNQLSVAASTVSINQVDRNVRTPYTDEVSFGFERELAPEWSGGITYIRRRGYDLLQDQDYNHVTCPTYGTAFGIDPYIICGDGGFLETDRFGDVASRFQAGGDIAGGNFGFNPLAGGTKIPNQAPDLYTVNNGFNQVLRVGNYNSSDYKAYEFKVVKRLHRNWQMQASYTWSEAFGQAEAYGSALGNDPETTDDEEGYLLFDQRHVLKCQAVIRLPKEVSVGANVQWASGIPFSIISTRGDFDSTGNTNIRRIYPTHQRNDQRNIGQWKIDGRLEKNFVIGKVQASAYLSAENLLNADPLTIRTYDVSALDGNPLRAINEFGRRFEIGTTLNF